MRCFRCRLPGTEWQSGGFPPWFRVILAPCSTSKSTRSCVDDCQDVDSGGCQDLEDCGSVRHFPDGMRALRTFPGTMPFAHHRMHNVRHRSKVFLLVANDRQTREPSQTPGVFVIIISGTTSPSPSSPVPCMSTMTAVPLLGG